MLFSIRQYIQLLINPVAGLIEGRLKEHEKVTDFLIITYKRLRDLAPFNIIEQADISIIKGEQMIYDPVLKQIVHLRPSRFE